MNTIRFIAFALITAVAPITAASAHAQAPSPGDPCSVSGATSSDANGRTMWCSPTMTGNHSLFWGYVPPS